MIKKHASSVRENVTRSHNRRRPRRLGEFLTVEQIRRREDVLNVGEALIAWLGQEQWAPPTRDPETLVRRAVLEAAQLAVSGARWRLENAVAEARHAPKAFVDQYTIWVSTCFTNAGVRQIQDTLRAWETRRSDCWLCRSTPAWRYHRDERR